MISSASDPGCRLPSPKRTIFGPGPWWHAFASAANQPVIVPNRIRPAMARATRSPEKWRARLSPKSFRLPQWSRHSGQIAEYKRFRDLTRDFVEVSEKVCDAQLHAPTDSASREFKKTGARRGCRSVWPKRSKIFWAQKPLKTSISKHWKRPCVIEPCRSLHGAGTAVQP